LRGIVQGLRRAESGAAVYHLQPVLRRAVKDQANDLEGAVERLYELIDPERKKAVA